MLSLQMLSLFSLTPIPVTYRIDFIHFMVPTILFQLSICRGFSVLFPRILQWFPEACFFPGARPRQLAFSGLLSVELY
jgi:hypothetical protein